MIDLASSMPITQGAMNTEGNKGQELKEWNIWVNYARWGWFGKRTETGKLMVRKSARKVSLDILFRPQYCTPFLISTLVIQMAQMYMTNRKASLKSLF